MSYWIKFGALYTPCMREDTEVTKYLLQQREAECGADQGEQGFNSDCTASATNDGFEGYSCCVLGIPGDNRTDIRILDPVQCEEVHLNFTRIQAPLVLRCGLLVFLRFQPRALHPMTHRPDPATDIFAFSSPQTVRFSPRAPGTA